MSKTLRRKKVLIRVDGYNKIGLGHIYRTIVIANHLNNHDVLFVSKKEHALGINLLKENNHKKERERHQTKISNRKSPKSFSQQIWVI